MGVEVELLLVVKKASLRQAVYRHCGGPITYVVIDGQKKSHQTLTAPVAQTLDDVAAPNGRQCL